MEYEQRYQEEIMDLFDEVKDQSKKDQGEVNEAKYRQWYDKVVKSSRKSIPCTSIYLCKWINSLKKHFRYKIEAHVKYGMVRGVLIVAIREKNIHQCAFEYLSELYEEDEQGHVPIRGFMRRNPSLKKFDTYFRDRRKASYELLYMDTFYEAVRFQRGDVIMHIIKDVPKNRYKVFTYSAYELAVVRGDLEMLQVLYDAIGVVAEMCRGGLLESSIYTENNVDVASWLVKHGTGRISRGYIDNRISQQEYQYLDFIVANDIPVAEEAEEVIEKYGRWQRRRELILFREAHYKRE